jgi:hypothetical protein
MADLGLEFREAGTIDPRLAPARPQVQQTQGGVDNSAPNAPLRAGEKIAPNVVDPVLEHADRPPPLGLTRLRPPTSNR